jgi:hypothetical protein
MIAWSQVERDFDWNGSLHDIYVRPATLQDWSVICRVLKKLPGVEFRLDSELTPYPEDIAHVFALRSKKSPMLSVRLGAVTAVFHFFTEEEVECDIDPRSVKSQIELDEVLAFLKLIGDAVAKPVMLTPENCPESEIVRYEPSSQKFRYTESKEANQPPKPTAPGGLGSS